MHEMIELTADECELARQYGIDIKEAARRKRDGKPIVPETFKEMVDHPPHYGGADNPHEAIKVIEAWGLNFNLGNCVKYLSRADKKGNKIEDLRKARWYLDREIENLTNG